MINVVVARNNQFINWANSRPARCLPNGNLGVVYQGLVMPVYSQRFENELSIEMSDAGFSKAECSFWNADTPFQTSDQIQPDENLNWYIETNQFGHYFVFDGDELIADRVINCLENYNIEIRSSGLSSRCADNGHQYDWYLRLQFDGTRDEILALIRRSLEGGFVSDVEEVPTVDFETQLEQLRIIHAQSISLLEQRIAENDDLKIQLQELSQNYQALQSTEHHNNQIHLRRIAQLNSTIANLETQLMGEGELSNETQRLTAEIENLRAIKNEAEELYYLEVEENSIRQIEAEKNIAELQEIVKNLRQELSRPGRPLTQRKYDDLLNSTLSTFSNIELHPDAPPTIKDFFTDNPGPIIQLLFRLNNGENIPSSAIRGAEGWFELNMHINTGQDNLGRIYFRRGDRLYVVIHKKRDGQEQQRFFRKLNDTRFLVNQGF